MSGVRVDVASAAGIRAVARDFRRAGKSLAGLSTQLRQPTRALGEAIREDILTASLPARARNPANRFPRRRSQGVRRPTAAAVHWSVRVTGPATRCSILFDPDRMPHRIRPLFKYWVGQRWRLRHPVPNTARKVWVSQDVPKVWRQAQQLVPATQQATARVLDAAARMISGKG